MNENYTDQIEGILVKNNVFISDLGAIYRVIDAEIAENVSAVEYTDMTLIDSLQAQAKAIDKKIKDNIITMNSFLARNVLPDSYYENQANNFLKRAIHDSNDIPLIIQSGTTVSAQAIFKNVGLFYSWTDDKDITLEISLVDSDNNHISVDNFLLDTLIEGNEPGEESTNEDYEKEKLFNISLDILPVPPGGYIFTLTIKDLAHRFLDNFKVDVTML